MNRMLRVTFGAATLGILGLSAIRLRGYWIASYRGEGAALQRAALLFAPLRGAALQSANLTGADLRHADLQGASLALASLAGATLVGADLQSASLTYSDVTGADLRHADLRGVDLTLTQGLTAANFIGALFDEDTQWPDGFDPERCGAQLATTTTGPAPAPSFAPLARRVIAAMLAAIAPYSPERDFRSVKAVIDRGRKGNTRSRDLYGRTALSLAAYLGDAPLVTLLLDRGAVVNAVDNRGWTPLHYVVEGLYRNRFGWEGPQMPEDEVLIPFLGSRSATVPPERRWGSHVEVARLLLDHGADPSFRTKLGFTPLQHFLGEGVVWTSDDQMQMLFASLGGSA